MITPDRKTDNMIASEVLPEMTSQEQQALAAPRDDLYVYLALKLADLEMMSDDDIMLLEDFADLDTYRAVRVAITPQFVRDAAAVRTHELNSEERHALRLYLSDKINDGEILNKYERRLLIYLFTPDHSIDADMLLSKTTGNAPLSAEEALEEYGYDIYDYHALILRLSDIYAIPVPGDRRNPNPYPLLPLSQREIRLIKRLWDIDPEDAAFTAHLLESYQNTFLYPDMEDAHASRTGRYRQPAHSSAGIGYREEEDGI